MYRALAERRSGPGDAAVSLEQRLDALHNALLQVGLQKGGRGVVQRAGHGRGGARAIVHTTHALPPLWMLLRIVSMDY